MKFLVVFAVLCVAAFGSRIPILGGRIVGGSETTIEKFPYQVSVRVYDQHICGGSIIDHNTVLTAAHCTDGMDVSRFSVRLGATNNNQGLSIRVTSVRQNADYDEDTVDNDMSILKLESSIEYDSTKQPITLQPEGVEVPAGTYSLVSGWGATYEGSDVTPDNLRFVDMNVISHTSCVAKYGPGQISSNMLCTQTLDHDACQGDSGGPLAANGKLIGVVSWGIGCADPNYPGIFAKVSAMHSWIMDNKY